MENLQSIYSPFEWIYKETLINFSRTDLQVDLLLSVQDFLPFMCTWTEVINGGSDEVTVQEAVQLLIELAGEVSSFFTRGWKMG